jgi:hypothetical protein
VINFAEPEKTVEELLQDFPELLHADVVLEKEVYAHFGLLYMGFALLEHSLINVVTINQNIIAVKKQTKPNLQIWEAQYDKSFAHAAAQTFGNLAKVVVTVLEFKDLADGLHKVKKIRDYFSHHFFRREAAHMSEPQSAFALLLDIDKARELVKMVEAEMKPRHFKYMKRIGLPDLSDSYIDEESVRLAALERDKLHQGLMPRGISRWLDRGQED